MSFAEDLATARHSGLTNRSIELALSSRTHQAIVERITHHSDVNESLD